MTVKVRRATAEDIGWLVNEVQEFVEFAGYHKLFDYDYLPTLVKDVVTKHLCLVAYDDTGTRMGMLAAFIGPHPYNPKKTLLSELCWWVPEAYRKTRAGLALLVTYAEWGKRNADFVTMSNLKNSPIKAESLRKRGFEMKEQSYVWEKS
jgi:hypothetical protein